MGERLRIVRVEAAMLTIRHIGTLFELERGTRPVRHRLFSLASLTTSAFIIEPYRQRKFRRSTNPAPAASGYDKSIRYFVSRIMYQVSWMMKNRKTKSRLAVAFGSSNLV